MAQEPGSVENDRRWRAFNDKGFDCSCGEKHVRLFPIHIEVPLGWSGSREYEPNEALRLDGNFLSESYCVREGKHFYLRCRLPVRVLGDKGWAFTYSVYASLDRPTFEAYVDAKAKGKLDSKTRMTARLENRLSGWPDTYNLMGTAYPQTDNWPAMFAHGLQANGRSDHPLIVQQQTGIGMDRMLELFAVYGHDMKSAAGQP